MEAQGQGLRFGQAAAGRFGQQVRHLPSADVVHDHVFEAAAALVAGGAAAEVGRSHVVVRRQAAPALRVDLLLQLRQARQDESFTPEEAQRAGEFQLLHGLDDDVAPGGAFAQRPLIDLAGRAGADEPDDAQRRAVEADCVPGGQQARTVVVGHSVT